jgi:hypothetical protein
MCGSGGVHNVGTGINSQQHPLQQVLGSAVHACVAVWSAVHTTLAVYGALQPLARVGPWVDAVIMPALASARRKQLEAPCCVGFLR